MAARCLRCKAGNEWIEGTPTHPAARPTDETLMEELAAAKQAADFNYRRWYESGDKIVELADKIAALKRTDETLRALLAPIMAEFEAFEAVHQPLESAPVPIRITRGQLLAIRAALAAPATDMGER